MEERNRHMILNGQPDAVRHACDRCMRIFLMPNGTFREYYFNFVTEYVPTIYLQENARPSLAMV